MKKLLTILTIVIVTACSTRQANEKTIETPKEVMTSETPYDTVRLKGGYQLIYSTTNEKRNLRLKGQNTDTLIWTTEIDELEKYMGWLEADYKDQFVLYSSGGNGVYNMNLIDKRTGKGIIKGIGIKNDTIKNVIYYQDNESINDNLTLIDLGTMKKETYPPPTDIQCIQWWNCIDKIELTDNELTIDYFNTPKTKRVKKYSRYKFEIISYDTLNVKELIGLFEEQELKKYSLDPKSKLMERISESSFYWRNKRLWDNNSLNQINLIGYPLSFRKLNNKNSRITTVNEAESQNQIIVITIDEHFNIIDTKVLAGFGGDEGITSRIYGEFINDSTYARTTEITEYDSDKIEQTYRNCFVFRKSGLIEEIKNCR